ncbi:plasmid partitioning protein RepB [Phaeobacter inhibens]|uniref:plasmid partitioning protein RepB n=1 Tax=Phaeobacter inhibens TaxID=221822 RepID=UPI002770DDF1|nr:plasmid partitioning protein RepB [Phaeobacter inhibens]GLO72814.1 plasmid partitioning protein RepB [Phaeobacter inhibens]
MARKGILSSDTTPTTAQRSEPKARMMPRGAVGALQSSLTRLQENAVQDIDAALIDDAGLEDRLGLDNAAHRQLVESLRTYGQQVPVLLRPHAKVQGRFEIVYGRRRLKALRELGVPVKAMIRQLDDHALVMAQGQENTARQDLSFIEKASFAAQLQDSGYDRQTIAAALSIDMPMVSRMLKVGTAFELDFLRQIGSAPGIGRERWMALAKAMQEPGARARVLDRMRTPNFPAAPSDARFEAALALAKQSSSEKPKPKSAKAPAPPARVLEGPNGRPLADLRRSGKGVSVTIAAKDNAEFDAWFEANAETLLNDLHERFTTETSEE